MENPLYISNSLANRILSYIHHLGQNPRSCFPEHFKSVSQSVLHQTPKKPAMGLQKDKLPLYHFTTLPVYHFSKGLLTWTVNEYLVTAFLESKLF